MTWKQYLIGMLVCSLAIALILISAQHEPSWLLRFFGCLPITYYVVGYYRLLNEKNKKD